VLAVDAHREHHARFVVDDVPAAAVAHGAAAKRRRELAVVPGLGVAVAGDVVEPARRDDGAIAAASALHDELAHAREIAKGHAEAAGAARGAAAVDGDRGGVLGAHRLPQEVAGEHREPLAGRALDRPAE